MARKPKAALPVQHAYIVPTDGTDEEVRQLCAASVEGWADLREDQKADLVRQMRSYNSRPAAPAMRVIKTESGALSIGTPEGANVSLNALRLANSLGSKSGDFADAMVGDLTTYHNKANKTGAHSTNVSASLAFVHGANAQDTVQAALAVQMAATHDAAMRSLASIGGSQFADHMNMYANISAKLLNVYARQAEVLAKLQRGGEQTIKHVHVDNRGGQAVFTDQVVTGGADANTEDRSHEPSAAMLGYNAGGYGVPVPGNEGEEAVQTARWQKSGTAER